MRKLDFLETHTESFDAFKYDRAKENLLKCSHSPSKCTRVSHIIFQEAQLKYSINITKNRYFEESEI